MNLWWYIARRYFLSGNKRSFINLLSIISLLGVAVGTAALVIVLSAFNGMRDLARDMYQVFDPTFKVMPAQGKYLEITPENMARLKAVPGVWEVSDALEDNVLLMYKGSQAIVKLKAVRPYQQFGARLRNNMVAGAPELEYRGQQQLLMGLGLVQALQLDPTTGIEQVEIWYPKNKKTASINPEKAFSKEYIRVGGAFSIEAGFDNQYIMAPVQFAEQLMQAGNKRTYLEVSVRPGTDLAQVKQALTAAAEQNWVVQDPDDQHADLVRILKLEKMFVFVALCFILLIASFNIYVSLSMLALDKVQDISILRAMGATDALLRKIFLGIGSAIALSGAGIGLVLGLAVVVAQDQLGLVSMGITNALVSEYPVKVEVLDLVAIGSALIAITLISAWGPAQKAASIDTRALQ